METDIRKLPIIPDETALYMTIIAIIDHYDKSQDLIYFMTNLDFVRSYYKCNFTLNI